MEFDPGVGIVHRRHHPGEPQPQRSQAAIEVGVVEMGMEDVRAPGFEQAPHRAHDPPGRGPFDIQPQADHLIALGPEFKPHGTGGAEGGHRRLEPLGVQAPDDGRHQVFRPAHRHGRQEMEHLQAPGRKHRGHRQLSGNGSISVQPRVYNELPVLSRR